MRGRRLDHQPVATVIGAGKFGHAIADIVSCENTSTHLITRSDTRLEEIRHRLARHSATLSVHKFGTVPLADNIFLALPSTELPEMVGRLRSQPDIDDKQFVLLAKGLTYPDGETPLELMSRTFGAERCVVMSGPSLADELPRYGARFVVASSNPDLADYVADMVNGGPVRTQLSDDPTGVEWAGIGKNVATLGFHTALAATRSRNYAGSFAAELYSETWRYAETLGARAESFLGLAGVGDLMTTVTAPTSRNARAGELIGQGKSVAEAETRIKQSIESFHTVPLLSQRIKKSDGTNAPSLSSLSNRITRGR